MISCRTGFRVLRRSLIRNVDNKPCDVVLHRMPVPAASPLWPDDATWPDAHGNSALHVACTHGRLDLVASLLTADAALARAANRDGLTPLHLLALHSMFQPAETVRVVELLLDHGADVNAADRYRHTPLHIACGAPTPGLLVRLLLARGADVNARSAQLATPLLRASRHGVRAFADELLTRSELDLDALQQDGLAALHVCAFFNHDAFTRALLDSRRCNVELRATVAARSALQIAVARGSGRAARELVRAGASRDGVDAALLDKVLESADAGHKKTTVNLNWNDGFV